MKMQQQQAALIKHGFIYKRTNKGTGLYCAEALEACPTAFPPVREV